MNKIIIDIKKDFSDAPGARYIKDGPHSGEEFFNKLLKPKFVEAQEKGLKLEINLDGVWGYPSSFVSGSFGKLSLEYTPSVVLGIIEFVSEESETRKERIIAEIQNPTQKSNDK